MPREPEDNDDEFNPEDYGWSEDEWDELLDIYGFEDYEDLIDAHPELTDFGDWMDELDYFDDVMDYNDDDDFYG